MSDSTENADVPVWYETEMLEWFQVERFFKEYGCVMVDCPELRWYQESWGALKKSGLASNTEFDDEELAETALKLRAICLMAMYLGMYQAAGEYSELGGYFSEHDFFSSYLSSLDIEMSEVWELVSQAGYLESEYESYWEDEEADDDLLCATAIDLVSSDNAAIFKSLEQHFGGKTELFVSLWNSRLPLDDIEATTEIVNYFSPGDGKQEIWLYVENGMKDWSWE